MRFPVKKNRPKAVFSSLLIRIIIIRRFLQYDGQAVLIHRQRLELEAADGVLMVNVGLDLLVHHAPADVLVNSEMGRASCRERV